MRLLFLLLVLANVGIYYWYAHVIPRAPEAAQTRAAVEQDPDVPSLVLLSEVRARGDAGTEAVGAARQDNHGSGSTGKSARMGAAEVCRSAGPFTREEEIEKALKLIGEAGASAVRRRGAREEPIGYWVYLPPLGSESAARRLDAELQRRGIDSFVITEGGYRNGISLGIFNFKHTAEALKARLEAEGYAPRMDRRYRDVSVTWLDVRRQGDPIVTEALWDQLRSAFGAARVVPLDCGELRGGG